MKEIWWKEAVIYQIYPKSFRDSNGDGMGDLRGVIEKLDYLKQLGIQIIWLSPCYSSPNVDNGYDISNYREISPEFGNMKDFDELLSLAHSQGIRIVMDLVINHTSDQHPWFLESKKAKDNPYRDYYIWRKGKDGKEPNNWGSYFTPSVWTYEPKTEEYYLHSFAKEQPDLNWENPKVREEMKELMHFWLKKGIDGYRMDVVNLYKKPEGLQDSILPPTCAEGYSFDPALYANNNPGLLDFLNELKTEVLSQYDVMTVGETVEVTPEIAIQYVNEENGPINMVFHFQITNLKEKFTWQKFKKVQRAWIHTFSEQNGWNSQYLQNHDQPRCVSIYGDAENFRVVSAKMLATMLHTLPGTPYVYQGEEIGMTNTDFPSIDLFDDINAKFSYNELLLSGKSKEAALEELNRYSRDHARTPMQWSNEKGAGFTTGTPWLMINPNYKEINVEEAEKDPNSIFHYYQQLIQLRKEHKVFVYGDFTEYFQDSDSVYIYTRSFEEETIGVLLNLTGKEQEIVVPFAMGKKIIIGNYLHHKEGSTVTLHPYEAIVCL